MRIMTLLIRFTLMTTCVKDVSSYKSFSSSCRTHHRRLVCRGSIQQQQQQSKRRCLNTKLSILPATKESLLTVDMEKSMITTTAATCRSKRWFNSLYSSTNNNNHKKNNLRLFSTSTNFVEYDDNLEDDNKNNDNMKILPPSKIPLPKSLSPSAILCFKQCPQSFLFQYLYKIKQPTTLALAKGSMCHDALDKVFDLEPKDRTLYHLQNLLRVSWSEHRLTDTYRFLFEEEKTPINQQQQQQQQQQQHQRDIASEQEWGRSALQLLDNYYHVEDPRTVIRPNPLRREVWVSAHLTVDPLLGVTAPPVTAAATRIESNDDEDSTSLSPSTFFVRGIIDRIDMVRVPASVVVSSYDNKTLKKNPRDVVALRIIDYKTGKAPNLKYSKQMNDKIIEEAFYQLKIYALLLAEQGGLNKRGGGKKKRHSTNSDGSETNAPYGSLDLRWLRLFYLTSEAGVAEYLDLDLGEFEWERNRVLQETHQDLSKVWTEITDLVSRQDPTAFVGCDRSFCYCHTCRERFVRGTVWQP